jgi:transposase
MGYCGFCARGRSGGNCPRSIQPIRPVTGVFIGDRAYESDPLDRRLKRDYGIELIAPNRENRSQTQDGRKLRRYKRRWCGERLFAWLQWFRRLVTRDEYHSENYLGMVRLGCMRIMLRYL